MRIDISTTINYFYNLYSTGRASELEIRDSMQEVCTDVLSFTHPEFTQDEIKERVKILIDEMLTAFRVEGTVKRMMSRFSGKLRA
jgi:hypothetical protein